MRLTTGSQTDNHGFEPADRIVLVPFVSFYVVTSDMRRQVNVGWGDEEEEEEEGRRGWMGQKERPERSNAMEDVGAVSGLGLRVSGSLG